MNSPLLTSARTAVTRVAGRALNSTAAARAARLAYSRSMAMPLERTDHRCSPGTVTAVLEMAPWLRRLTLHVPGLEGYEPLGPDEYVGLVMPRPGTSLPDLSEITGPNPRPVVGAMPEETRPDVRWYTVRDWRPDTHELDVEVVLHPEGQVDEGPGATWVRGVAPGAEVAVQTGTTCYHPEDARVQVIAGDETAYPAVTAIIEAARGTDRELHVFLELAEDGVVPTLSEPGRGTLTLVPRRGQREGAALLAAVEAADLPVLDYGWVCGEQDLAATVRKHLVDARGLRKTDVFFSAYWILGRPRG